MDTNRPLFGIHEHLVISLAPLANQNLINKRLIDAGVLPAGAYELAFYTKGLSAVDVYLEPTAATAGGTPSVNSISLQVNPAIAPWANPKQTQTVVLDTIAGVAFVANTVQKLSLTGLNGTEFCKVLFTVTTSLDFTPATTHGRAEVRGL